MSKVLILRASMHVNELDFPYPENLVATDRAPISRVMLTRVAGDVGVSAVEADELENGLDDLIAEFQAGDVLVINDTKVLSRRVFAESGLEILFLTAIDDATSGAHEWSVLCPATRWKNGVTQNLPGGVTLELTARGRPQTVRASEPLSEAYFDKHGDLPLPPYIQKARDERRNRHQDKTAYQTSWAEKPGSLAAPTASLHFTNANLESLKAKGVKVAHVTLHVGLGTFLPVTTDQLEDHIMHAELAEIPQKTWTTIIDAKARGHHVWALGTTVTRTLESAANGLLDVAESDVVCEHVVESSAQRSSNAEPLAFLGETKLFITPGYQYKIIDRLLTNFHQPRSTLLALVSAFAGLENVKQVYSKAIEKGFRLFSYGDLSVWIKT